MIKQLKSALFMRFSYNINTNMNENQLRLRQLSNNTKPKDSQTAQTSNETMSLRSDGNKLDPIPSESDLLFDEEIDEKYSDNEKESLIRKKFITNERQELIELLYSEDVIKFSKTNAKQDSSDSEDNNQIITSFITNDRKPLLDSVNSKRKLSRKQFRSEFLVDDDSIEEHIVYEESLLSLYIQVFVPFLIAGFGTVGAGLVLDYVQHWDVFRQVSEVFILVPALLGLKGNLEMTLASRLSTQANLGHINTGREQWLIASGNIALIQCQATIVAFLAAMFAITMDWLPEGQFNFNHALLLCASSLLTASIASFILGIQTFIHFS